MTTRRFNLKPNAHVAKCPKCGNNTAFVAHSAQVAEDCCEVWVVCVCGYDPHTWKDKLESVMGGCDEYNIRDALGCWNDVLSPNNRVSGPRPEGVTDET